MPPKNTKLPSVSPDKGRAGKGGTTTNSRASSNNNRAGNKLPNVKGAANNNNNNSKPAEGSRAAKKAEEAAKLEEKRLKKEKENERLEAGLMDLSDKFSLQLRIYTKEQEEVAEKARLEAIAEEKRIRGNGKVKLMYEQYDEEFDIVDGSTTQANIDDVYCLSFVMPGCIIHLSDLNPQEFRKKQAGGVDEDGQEIEGVAVEDLYLKEEPRGTYLDMEKDKEYYVYVVQQEDQLKRDQERMKEIAAKMEQINSNSGGDNVERDDGRGFESCSCIYGNPCVDEYSCRDWDNRMAVAMKNGWKGF